MFLSKLTIKNFRRLDEITFNFVDGLNVIVGENNIGKTALVDALRVILASHEDPYLRITEDDIFQPQDGREASGDITFHFVFSDLNESDEADFLHALVPIDKENFEAHIHARFSLIDASGRMRLKRWCGEHEEVGMTSDMLENLRGVYLQPLRDASKGLKPGRNSQLARLMRLIGEEDTLGRQSVDGLVSAFEKLLKRKPPLVSTGNSIVEKHKDMLGKQLSQELSLGLSGADFKELSSKLSITANGMEIDTNGLGYNNLIFMAVVLSEMIKDPSAAYRGLIIEEPEAHLHPQLQVVLLDYFQAIAASKVEKSIQLFVTTHSSNFASLANLENLTCMVDRNSSVKVFNPREATFDPSPTKAEKKRKKLERYLDVTKAELFFARKLILVEGTAELMLIGVLAKQLDYDLQKYAVSIISVDGLNFDCFLPLMGQEKLAIPVSVITDADPTKEDSSGNKKTVPLYPSANDNVIASDNTRVLKGQECELVKVFFGVKTLEYDLALYEDNRSVMLDALSEIHPLIAKSIKDEVNDKTTDQEKAKALFCGMFERGDGLKNVQKGQFAQELAYQVSNTSANFVVPGYIRDAIKHVIEGEDILDEAF
ncbi:ATP-dependent endonuclease [Pseudoalteromonas sp. P1-8]|uniref:ATP-dependent nuclease n=1 Tax=Pseudoalteromonas sp. P1-8 TaxID=1710353 RepID=UPI0006DC9556|nr:AAA family ATPase [Pseudoalteromonas sp. P1-8]KPW03626.1 DNA replication and repair protein RecF [Pseudoalteromonas sp. P1-8]